MAELTPDQRAEALLASLLSDAEWQTWRSERRVVVPARGGRFVIQGPLSPSMDPVVSFVLPDGRAYPYCTRIRDSAGLPMADKVATYVLLARADADGALPLRGVRGLCDCPACFALGPPLGLGAFYWRGP